MVSSDTRALTIEITYMRKVNWSLLRAGIPLVWKLSVRNEDSVPARDLMVRLWLPDYLDTGPVSLPEIAPGATHEVNPRELPWIRQDFAAAMSLTKPPATTYLQVEVGAHTAACPIGLLTPDEWCAGVSIRGKRFVRDPTVELSNATIELPSGGTVHAHPIEMSWSGDPPLQAATAVLVLPMHPRVAEIKNHAITLLAAIADAPRVSLDEWVSGTSQQQTQVVQAVFAALADLYPKAHQDIEKFSLQVRSQRIRLPDEAVNGDIAQRHGATCVDFALLVCAVLAACGLNPLFILVGTRARTCHAMVGCWLGGASASGPLLTSVTDIQQYVRNGYMLAVDVTEFSKGNNFRQACELREDCLQPPNQWCYALDVMAAYDERRIEPLPWVAPPAAGPERPPGGLVGSLPPSRREPWQEWLAATMFARRNTKPRPRPPPRQSRLPPAEVGLVTLCAVTLLRLVRS